jgi:hypothetical protein
MHCPNVRVTSPTLLSVSYIKTISVLLTKISVFFVAVCLSCFDFGKGGGVVVCLVLFLLMMIQSYTSPPKYLNKF